MKNNRIFKYITMAVFLPLILTACSIGEEPDVEVQRPPAPVEVITAQLKTVDYSERFTGRIQADANLLVYPRTTGKITAVYVKPGDDVARNKALIKIDDSMVQDSIKQAESALAAAEANHAQAKEQQESAIIQAEAQLKLAQDAYNSAEQNLVDAQDSQYITQEMKDSQIKQAESALLQAETNLTIVTNQVQIAHSNISFTILEEQIKQAQINVEQAKRMLNDIYVYAPVAGEIAAVNVRVGEMAAPQVPVAQIVSQNRVYLAFFVTDNSLSNYELNQKIAVYIPSLSEERTGTVTYVAPAASEQTLTFMIEVELDNTDSTLKSGMLAETRQLADGKENKYIVIPTRAVMGVGDESYVFVVEDGKAYKRNIEMLEMRTEDTVILAGIEEEDLIVIRGQYILEDEMKIEIIE